MDFLHFCNIRCAYIVNTQLKRNGVIWVCGGLEMGHNVCFFTRSESEAAPDQPLVQNFEILVFSP